MSSRVIAIDGPAGSGKSTTARAVAQKMGLSHLDSGALYRAVTLAALDNDLDLSGQKIVGLARSLPVCIRLADSGFLPEVAGVDVSREIRSDRVTAKVSPVSALPEVREWVNAELHAAAATHPRGTVLDGRDIGTVVFPDAAVKVFLVADPEVRARRRLLQVGRAVDEVSIKEETASLNKRDKADSTRAVAPLTAADDAIMVDTTNLAFDEQVDQIVNLAKRVLK